MATVTLTIDTASTPYNYRDGLTTTFTGTAQDFTFEFTDVLEGGRYVCSGTNSDCALADGYSIEIAGEISYFELTTDATATLNAGSIWVRESRYGNALVEWKIRSVTIADADGTGANNLTQMILERTDNPMITMTWANLNMA